MQFLFDTIVAISGRSVRYKVFTHTPGTYYAESMNPDYDNFLLKKTGNGWSTSLDRNLDTAAQIGEKIEREGKF